MERGFGRIPNHVERQRWLADNCLAKGQEFYDRVLRQKTEGNIPQTGATVDESDWRYGLILWLNEDKDRAKIIVSTFLGYQDPNRKYWFRKYPIPNRAKNPEMASINFSSSFCIFYVILSLCFKCIFCIPYQNRRAQLKIGSRIIVINTYS